MNKLKALIIFLFVCVTSGAQTILLNSDSKDTKNVSEHGQNLHKFSHAYFRFGLLASKDYEGARIVYGNSLNLSLGIRKKYKISPVYSFGFEAGIQYTDYKLKQTTGKILPDTIINNISGRLDFFTLEAGIYNRFNFDPNRGNFIGSFFDIGIAGEFHFSINSISKNRMPDETILKSVVKNLPYTYNTNAKVVARFGYGHISFYGSYRLADLFKSSFNYPDLPRLVLGIELGIY